MLRRLITPTRSLRFLPPRRPMSTSNYFASLRQRYPSADPPSLIISFLILHELTAIVPLGLLFGTFHYLGLGAGIVGWTLAESESTSTTPSQQAAEEGNWSAEGARMKVREWIREGEEKAERIGRRYGWFGWEKESKEQREERKSQPSTAKELSMESLKVSGDVANVAAAYLVVKALLPLRILVSLRLSPSLANVIVRRFKGLRDRGAKMLKRNQQVKD
ncbi:uncharacterized protein JCM6883_005099 [Sporobolomyces salmoneus]|uniref:uncharacterized protein n=1 Tax=Sporobolomyces salmoneus TaxID=183962 RepID=UPI0031739037